MLEAGHCRQRQKRLIQVLGDRKLDAVVCANPAHVYYFSAFLTKWVHQSAVVLFKDGQSWMTSANEPYGPGACDEKISYVADHLGTLRQEQPAVVAEQVVDRLERDRAEHIGVDDCLLGVHVAQQFEGTCESIESDLWQLRRCKDPDELELMKAAIRCSVAMHQRAREIIEPGIDEIEVFGQLHVAAVTEAGEPLSALLGNDYRCGAPGGPPAAGRKALAGQLYIIDVGPAYRGYFSDNTRTISVDRKPTEAQQQAWQITVEALNMVQKMARPGVRCCDIGLAIDEHFKTKGTALPHHLGHGVGLQPHEYPHLDPPWDDVLMAGEVFACEPGQYAKELACGLRLENQYLVTEAGAENLVAFPLEL